MKPKVVFTRKDLVVILICILFFLANIAAIGPGGRRRAREALCLSNLHKWGQVFQAYAADNDGYFHTRRIGDPYAWLKLWMYTYKPYYNDKMMRFCPAAADPNRFTGTFGVWDFRYGAFNPMDPEYWVPGEDGPCLGSYGLNRYVINMTGAGLDNHPAYWRRAGVKGAAQAPILCDCMYINYWSSPTADPPEYDGDWSGGDTQTVACINRHDGFINACFLDFSARKVGLKELWTLKHSRTFDTCGPWTICGSGGDEAACAAAWDAQSPWMKDFPEY